MVAISVGLSLVVFGVFIFGCKCDNCIRWNIGHPTETLCPGKEAKLQWNYTLVSHNCTNEVWDIQWFKWNKSNRINVARYDVEKKKFFALNGYNNRVVPSETIAGFIFKNVTREDCGSYSVRLIIKNNGKEERNGTINCAEPVAPMLRSSSLNITSHNATKRTPRCQELHCGTLQSLGYPEISFEWKRDGEIVHGVTDRKDNYSALYLCAGNNTGNFTCQLTGIASDCLPENSDLRKISSFLIPLEDDEGNDNKGPIIGGVLGAVAVLAVVAGVAVYFWRKKSRNVPKGTAAESENLKTQDTVKSERSESAKIPNPTVV